MKHLHHYLHRGALLALPLVALSLTACDDDEEENFTICPSPLLYDTYILSEGSYLANNATLGAIAQDELLDTDLYLTANGRSMGDTGQDLICANDRLYLSVSTSGYVAQLDLAGHELYRYVCPSEQGLPRYLCAHGDYLYVTLYGGFVARLSLDDLTLQGVCAVGSFPEQMALSGDYLVVANSGQGSDNTLSVIDLNTFSVVRTLTVEYNPQHILAAQNGRFYFTTTGYDANWTQTDALHELNPADWSIRTIERQAGYSIQMADAWGSLYLVECSTDYSTYTYHNRFVTYDYDHDTWQRDTPFIADSVATRLSDKCIYTLSVLPAVDRIYLSTTDYVTNSHLYAFESDGTFVRSWDDTGGINTSKVVAHTTSWISVH